MKKKVLLALAGVVLVLAIALGIVGCTSSNEERVNDKQEVMTEKDDSKEAVEDEKSLLEEKKTDRESDEEVEENIENSESVNESKEITSQKKETKTSNTSKKEDSSGKKTSSSDNNYKKEETEDETHSHSWEPVYKEVDNGYYEKVLVKAAWTEEVTKIKKVGAEICKGCGHVMFTEQDIYDHCGSAMLAGNTKCGTYKSGYVDVEVTERVEHPAEYADQWVPVIENVLTGYKCSCGATK